MIVAAALSASCWNPDLAHAQGSTSGSTRYSCAILGIALDLIDAKKPRLPDALPVEKMVVYDNQKYRPEIAWHPIAGRQTAGKVNNIMELAIGDALPQRFIIGDGSMNRAFIGVDQSPGTTLDRILSAITARLKSQFFSSPMTQEQGVKFVIENIRLNLAALVDSRWLVGPDRIGTNIWDPPPSVAKLGDDVKKQRHNVKFPVVPFERFLTEGCNAYCIHRALLTKLIFDRMGIPSKYVAGASVQIETNGKFSTFGHSWLEIKDRGGEIVVVDPEHQVVAKKGPANPIDADWFGFNNGYRYADHRWPILVLQ
jgi:hypothetical protein